MADSTAAPLDKANTGHFPGRCQACGYHEAIQGHRDSCPQTAPITPEPVWTDDFLENLARETFLEKVARRKNENFVDSVRALRHRKNENFIAPEPVWTDDFLENAQRIKRENFVANVQALYPKDRPPPRPRAPMAPTATAGHNPAYVEAAINAELATLAATPVGCRNHTLNICALKCFGFVKAGHAEHQPVFDALRDTALAIGLTLTEIEGWKGETGTLRSAWNGAKPRDIPQPGRNLTP